MAYVLISSRIYWKVANEDATNKPQCLVDFQNAHSLELVRLDDDKTWDDVDGNVKVDDRFGRPRITVWGRPHGQTQWKNSLFDRNVRVQIISNTLEQHEVRLSRIRARIAPWSVLQHDIKNVASRGSSFGVAELDQVLGRLVSSFFGTKLSSMSTDMTEAKWIHSLGTLPELVEKLTMVDKLTAHSAVALGSGVTLETLVESAERVAETAKLIANVSKVVAGVSAVFHLLALIAEGISMCAEVSRGRRILPAALCCLRIYLEYVLGSLTKIMTRGVNAIEEELAFDVLKVAVRAMDIAETQLLRGRVSEFMNAEDVKEVERKLEELRHKAVIVGNISKICGVDERVNYLEEELKICDGGLHHVRPSLSAFFSGRTSELSKLRDILEKRGSAVIAQYGGVGKTELMIAFADRAERDEMVPGGVFWVTVDGGDKNVIESLSRLAEKLTRRKMDEEERRNRNLVVAALKQGLGEREGRWLLCLDNADDSTVSGILNEVCGIAEGTRGNGWIVVTSRQGQPHIWSRMKRDQKLVLKPLRAEDAIVALWRQVQKIEAVEADDDGVMKDVKKLESADPEEYRALKELCGDERTCSLGGLPLALVQAGSYIARFDCSFAQYQNMFEKANRIEDIQNIMRNTDDVKPIRESQRSIWTTWKISVEQLSAKAYTVLRAMAMLGPGRVGEAIVTRIVNVVAADEGGSVDGMFEKIVIEELVQNSSLIWRYTREGQERIMYRMHRLVQRFILSDMESGSGVWNRVYRHALVCVHEAAQNELKREDKSFRELPDVFKNNHREIAAHAIALVHHHVLPEQDAEIPDVSLVEDIHRYSGKAMEFLGKVKEEVQVWNGLVSIYEHRQASSRRRTSNGHLLDVENDEKSHIADIYNSLGLALMRNGELKDAASKHKQSLEMFKAIHGPYTPHSDIAASLGNLGLVYRKQGKLNKALEKHNQAMEMRLRIHGPNKPHPDIARSLNNLGCIYEALGQLDNAEQKLQQSLKMRIAVHGPNKPHPDIARSLKNLGNVYQKLGKLNKASEKHKESLNMRLEIHGPYKPHPDIATSLGNLGIVYRKQRKLDKAMETHEQAMKMRLAIHGANKPHPHIAISLNNLGCVYEAQGKLEKSMEMHEQSLEMRLAVHGQNKSHPDIARSLQNLGDVYRRLGKLDEALEKHHQSLEMRRAIHGLEKPHPDIAISLWHIGFVYYKQKNLDQAAEFLEQSLEMLQTVHARNSGHPHIIELLSHLADVYEDQGRRDDASELRKRNSNRSRVLQVENKEGEA